MTVLLPSANRRSRFIFDWDAASCLEAQDRSLNARTGQVATFTRASTKTAYDANNAVRTVPYGLPAFHWTTDPVSGLMVPGVLLEDTVNNIILWSQDFSNAAWTKSGMTVIVNSTYGPDGAVSADTLVETATTSEHYANQRAAATVTDGAPMFFSCSLKGGRNIIYLSIVKKDGATVLGSLFDVAAGTVGTTDAGVTARIRPEANGFWRCSILVNVGAGATPPQCRVQPYVPGPGKSYLGNTGLGIYVANAHFAASNAAGFNESSFVPTTSAPATRNADALSFAWNYPVGPITAYVKYVDLGSGVLGVGAGVLDIGGNSATPRLIMYNGSSWVVNHSGLSLAGVPLTTFGSTVEFRGQLKADGSILSGVSANGATEAVTVDSTVVAMDAWAATKLTVNSYGAGTNGTASFQVVRIAAGVQSMAFMRAG